MKLSELQNDELTDKLVDTILFEGVEQYKEIVDVAIVLGSSKAHLYRLPSVVEAYKNGKVKKIITSGYTRNINGNMINEGEVLKDKAIQMGVNPQDIIVENSASNTYENFSFSRALLIKHDLLKSRKTIGIATTTYHMRRSFGIAEKVFENDNVRLVMFPGDDNSSNRNTWATNDKGRERCYSEAGKILWMVREGMINDWEIDTDEASD